MSRKIFGFPVTPLNRAEITAAVLNGVPSGAGARLIVTANVDHVVTLRTNSEFREAYDAAWLATADGMPIFLYAKLMRVALAERVAGSDLFIGLLPKLSPGVHRPAFLLPDLATQEWLARYLSQTGFDPEHLLCVVPPFGFEHDAAYSAELAHKIHDHRATQLFIGLGAPKSEIWAYRHRHELGDVYILAIGASLEFAAGLKKRAPPWMRRTGLEWFWRLISEPRRLAGRYLIRSWALIPAIVADIASHGERVTLR